MNQTAYLNGLTKEKELDLKMGSHRTNLRNMRSINKNEPELNPIEINKNKGKYLKNRRDVQIYLENEVLTQKIEKIIKSSRNSKYYCGSYKYSKSLNGHTKRTAQQKIDQDNLKMIVRLEESKPTYSTKKYLQQFEHLKQIEKKMSSAEFYLTDSPQFRKRKINTNRSFMSGRNSSFASNSSDVAEKQQIVKESIKLNDGNMWEINVIKQNKGLKITGEVSMNVKKNDHRLSQIKLIRLPIIEASIFLKKHCQNNLRNFIDHLKVDLIDGSLMLVAPQIYGTPSPTRIINPEQKKNNGIKLSKLEQLAGYQKKIPSRQLFNTPQSKPIDYQVTNNQLTKKDQTLRERMEKDEILLPNIESIKKSPISKDKKEKDNKLITKQQEKLDQAKEKVNLEKEKFDQKKEKVKKKEKSIELIKASSKSHEKIQIEPIQINQIKEQAKINHQSKEMELIHEQNKNVQEVNQENSLNKKPSQQEQNYEQQKFEQSMKDKPITKQNFQKIDHKFIKEDSSPSKQEQREQGFELENQEVQQKEENQKSIKLQGIKEEKNTNQQKQINENPIQQPNEIQHQQKQLHSNLNQIQKDESLNMIKLSKQEKIEEK